MTAATFQSTVNINPAFGVPGELLFDGPIRSEPLTLDSAGGTIGYAFTKSNTTNVATVGGTIDNVTVSFAGILGVPKRYASRGTSSNPLDPTLALPGYADGEFFTMGSVVVSLNTAGNIGDPVTYNTTTGALSAVAKTATFTASQSTTVLTVAGSPVPTGNIGIGTVVYNAGAIVGTIVSLGTGTGGAGTYNMNTSATVSSAAMTGNSVPASGYAFVPNAVVARYATSAAGLAVINLTN